MLKIRNLKKNFNEKSVLDYLNIDIQEGTIFGLVGINGAGKSTLLRCICGVYKPDAGSITFNDFDTYNQPIIRKDILFVADDVYYPVNSTIKTVKTFYQSFYDVDEMIYSKYLKIFNLKEDEQISNFSKGMKRQAALLFALAIRPKLLLLDECFDGLDPLIRLTVKKAIFELIEDRSITVIISSHNLKELEDVCDSFGILENGKISTYGDLLESKENVKKYQLAYSDEVTKEMFTGLDLLSYKQEGRVVNMVIKGNQEEIKHRLAETNPILMDELAVNFEELFIYEVESRGLLNE